MNVSAKELKQLWADGIKEAILQLIKRPAGPSDVATVVFPIWDATMAKMQTFFPNSDAWSNLSRAEKLQISEGHIFSFKNFEAALIESQFNLKLQGVDH